MDSITENTKIFYKQLTNKFNNLSLNDTNNDEIFLFEPLFLYNNIINNNKYYIEVSMKSFQLLCIYNKEQYIYFNNSKMRRYIYDKKIVLLPNKYLIETLVNVDINDNKTIQQITEIYLDKYFKDIILFYFLEYNIISSNVFILFNSRFMKPESLIIIFGFNFFYLKKKNYNIIKLLKYIDKETLVNKLIYIFGNDVNVLNYIIKNLVNNELVESTHYKYKLLSRLPIELLKKYSQRIFKPNKLYLKISNDSHTEMIINIIYNDSGLKYLYEELCIQNSPTYYFYILEYDIEINVCIKYCKLLHINENDNINDTSNTNKQYKSSYNDLISIESEYANLFNIKANIDNNNDIKNKINYVKDEINNFISIYYNDECEIYSDEDLYSYHFSDFSDDSDTTTDSEYENFKLYKTNKKIFYKDLNKICSLCLDNIEIFPFEYNIFGYYGLERIISFQISTFIEKYLNNTDDINKMLNNPEYIIQLSDKYLNNYIFIYLFQVCYIISLIHNKCSPVVILALIRYSPLRLKYYIEYKKILFVFERDKDRDFTIEEDIKKKFKSIPIIKNYIRY